MENAFAPPAVQEQAIAAYAPEHGDDDIRTPADLRRVLAEVRRGDHAVGHQSRPWQVSTVAAPVRDGGEVVAALSVVVPGTGSPNPGYGPAVRDGPFDFPLSHRGQWSDRVRGWRWRGQHVEVLVMSGDSHATSSSRIS
ncbi:IclR family transcriptional regulator C-terminal domain-containing protein [Streptomyces sp. NPDC059688]|uniref:IclR family transcriptional regulator domain-containing protein n=1 Tax=Streptomyces sp. NPDC059688 TaxID=3346906 RepID=UPI00367C0A31